MDGDNNDLESYFMKLRTEQEEIWNNQFQANEDPKSIRSRESSNSSVSIPTNGGDVAIKEPSDNDDDIDVNSLNQANIAMYMQEDVGVRSRERSFEQKPKLMSPSKLLKAKKRFSIQNSLVIGKEVELTTTTIANDLKKEFYLANDTTVEKVVEAKNEESVSSQSTDEVIIRSKEVSKSSVLEQIDQEKTEESASEKEDLPEGGDIDEDDETMSLTEGASSVRTDNEELDK